ncbi:MAG: hypothetical protein N2376_07515 [Clostridia bacterium]|nr:hypothetical protein [Clostridia bacterium]
MKKYKKKGNSERLPNSDRLIANQLIESNFICQLVDEIPAKADREYHITEFGENYLQFNKEKVFLKKLPVVISIIALIVAVTSLAISILKF